MASFKIGLQMDKKNILGSNASQVMSSQCLDGLSVDLQRACYGVWVYVLSLAWDQAFIVSAQNLGQVGERFAKSLELIIIGAGLVPNLSPVRVS